MTHAAQKVLVTGGKGLIGSHIVSELKRRHTVYSVDIDDFDLTREDEIQSLMIQYDADILINAFGLNHHIEDEDRSYITSSDNFSRYLEVNIVALKRCCEIFMGTRSGGVIINMSSVYGIVSPDPLLYPDGRKKDIGYTVTKTALLGLCRHLAAHCDGRFRINTLVLGGIQKDQGSAFVESYAKKTIVKRMMRIEEIMPALEMLIDPRNTYMTGAEIVIDGGYTIL